MQRMNELVEKILKTLAFYRKKALIQLRSWRYQISPVVLQKPIFVVGCSRAGTTLVYKTFSESCNLGSLQKETHDFWMDLHPLDERDWDTHAVDPEQAGEQDKNIVCQLFYTQTGRSRIVDKNNQNGLSVPYLYKLFPDAHFVYIKRNPGDNIDSLINGWGKADEFATWSEQLPESVQIDNGRYQRWCFFLAEGWRQLTQASIEEVCAFQYRAMNAAILSAKALIPAAQWHEISYETLIADPVVQFQQLFESCDVPFDEQTEAHCRDVLQKPYNTFSEIRVDKWKDGSNRDRIERVLPTLADVTQQMGY